MRSIRLDAWEFESNCSEETLALDISRRDSGQYSSLAEFAQELGLTWAPEQLSVPLGSLSQWGMVCAHLREHAQLDLGEGDQSQVWLLQELEWSEVHLLISTDAFFLRYQWFTTA